MIATYSHKLHGNVGNHRTSLIMFIEPQWFSHIFSALCCNLPPFLPQLWICGRCCRWFRCGRCGRCNQRHNSHGGAQHSKPSDRGGHPCRGACSCRGHTCTSRGRGWAWGACGWCLMRWAQNLRKFIKDIFGSAPGTGRCMVWGLAVKAKRSSDGSRHRKCEVRNSNFLGFIATGNVVGPTLSANKDQASVG